ncbi:MAG: hypothetical protein QM767_01615 [Anaeromyxobacter sp.]
MTTPSCSFHAQNLVHSRCGHCGRLCCELCTFAVGALLLCPGCVADGGPRPSDGALPRGLVGLGLAVLWTLVMVFGGTMVQGEGKFGLMVLGFLLIGLALGGLATSIIDRDRARGTGALLPTIALVVNGILSAVLVIRVLINAVG